MKLNDLINQGIAPKFNIGVQVTLISGDYQGLIGKVIKIYKDKLTSRNEDIIRYDVRINGGWCNKGAGYKGEQDFYGRSYYGKIILCDEDSLKRGKHKI